jgi:hypothetical protein
MAGQLRFTVSHTVQAPVGSIWQVLGDFGTEHRWSKQFDHCARDTDTVRVGTVRRCTLPKALMGRTEVREALTEYDRAPPSPTFWKDRPGRSRRQAVAGPRVRLRPLLRS